MVCEAALGAVKEACAVFQVWIEIDCRTRGGATLDALGGETVDNVAGDGNSKKLWGENKVGSDGPLEHRGTWTFPQMCLSLHCSLAPPLSTLLLFLTDLL